MMFRLAQRQLQGGALPKHVCNRWMASLSFEAFGEPSKILKSGSSVGVGEVTSGQVKVSLKTCPVTVEDIRALRGLSTHRSLTGVAGTYAVGTVTSVGAGVVGIPPSSQVLVASSSGTWTSEVLLPSQEVFPLDPSSPLDPSQAACLPDAASAWALLHNFTPLPLSPGDIVLRSAETSTLNFALDQIGAEMGVHVVAASDSDLIDDNFKAKISGKGGGVAKLAVTSGTGKSARAMHALTGQRGVLVTYNGGIAPLDSLAGVEIPSLSLIFKDQSVCGFDFKSWVASSPVEASQAISASVKLMQEGGLKFSPVAFKVEQIAEAVESAGSGKSVVIEL